MFPPALLLLLLASTATTSPAQAAMLTYSVATTYNGANCTGAINSTWIQALNNECVMINPEQSSKYVCGVQFWYAQSASCEGDFIVNPSLGECRAYDNQDNIWGKEECATYENTATVEVLDAECSEAATAASARVILPVGVCTPSATNPGGVHYYQPTTSSSSALASYQVLQTSADEFSFGFFKSADCSGPANITAVVPADTRSKCFDVDVSAVDPDSKAVRITINGDVIKSTRAPTMQNTITPKPSVAVVDAAAAGLASMVVVLLAAAALT